MNNKTYLTSHPQLYKKIPQTKNLSQFKLTKQMDVDIDQMASTLIEEQKHKIKQLEMQISAYKIQIQAEHNCKVDHGPYIESVERQISQIRNQQAYINEQINNCQLVENQVTPMEYYLWKKKQRINTYDISIAEICKDIERQRQEIQRSIGTLQEEGQQINAEIQRIQQRIVQLNSASAQSFTLEEHPQPKEQSIQTLIASNSSLKEQYNNLVSNNQFLLQNKQIVCMQATDNVRSIQLTLKSYLDGEKAKLVKQFKQMQVESKSAQISPLNTDEQNYKIDPLLADYNYKLKELYNTAPPQIKRIIFPIMQPLSWQKFTWRQFLQVQPKSENIYVEYRKLQTDYMQNEAQTEKLQEQIKMISHQLISEQLRSTQLAQNIRKLKKTLKK